jgi:DNA-binding FadR family transcriptional regulator
MERMGLVSRVAEDLERVISQGRLPRDGSLPSEQLLSRQYGVSRTTVREALRHLAARGLIVQHPGRRSRVVPLDETVTLENLGVALHGEGPARPERSRLLEGFLALKRELTVELLAACCEHASQVELDRLQEACFALRDAVRWEEDRRQWAAWEFELLRRAARAADRPGHLLLIHSLERSFCGMAGRVLPHLESAAVRRWAECALSALGDKDAQALRRDLSPLLKIADERLLDSRGPDGKKVDTSPDPLAEATPSGTSSSAAATAATPTGRTSPVEPPCGESSAPGAGEAEGLAGSVWPNRSACMTGSCETRPTGAPPLESAATSARQSVDSTALGAGELSAHEPGREVHPPGAPSLAVEQRGATAPDEVSACAASSLTLLGSGAAGPPERE